MLKPEAEDAQALVDWARTNESSSFYRGKWGNETLFDRLLPITRDDLISVSLSRRRYKSEKALIKIVRSTEGAFASQWSFSDSAKEEWGDIGLRPLVYLEDPDDALEKSLWCYERNVLPLIAEVTPDITSGAAEFYDIDSMIVDAPSLPKIRPYLERRKEPLEYTAIHGASFDCTRLLPYASYAKRVELILTLPETGAIAHAPLGSDPLFKPVSNCHVDLAEDVLLTKLAKLTTPIIRYKLPAETARHLKNS